MLKFAQKKPGTMVPCWAFDLKRDRAIPAVLAGSGWLQNFVPPGRVVAISDLVPAVGLEFRGVSSRSCLVAKGRVIQGGPICQQGHPSASKIATDNKP